MQIRKNLFTLGLLICCHSAYGIDISNISNPQNFQQTSHSQTYTVGPDGVSLLYRGKDTGMRLSSPSSSGKITLTDNNIAPKPRTTGAGTGSGGGGTGTRRGGASTQPAGNTNPGTGTTPATTQNSATNGNNNGAKSPAKGWKGMSGTQRAMGAAGAVAGAAGIYASTTGDGEHS